jgi:hypothetical protein
MAKPVAVEIRSYQVGFGDCFLMSVEYDEGPVRHVLIDFGSMAQAKGSGKTQMMDVAKDIAARVNGGPFAVVATHRHKDHISGFARNKTGGTGAIIAGLEPSLVIQPWTENPDIAVDATAPVAVRGATRRMASEIRSLAAMQGVAGNYVREARRNHQYLRSLGKDLKSRIDFIGEDNIANASAVRNLIDMGSRPGATAEYLNAGQPSGLAAFLDAKVDVLGPPTVDQHAAVKRQNPRDPGEYWHLAAMAAGATPASERGRVEPLFPGHVEPRVKSQFPIDARWFVRRMREMRGRQMLQIVRTLDKAMNNTSLILLFRIGSKSFLFPGDAQGENWSYALSQPAICRLLANVDLYKVGHHGSLNATPKTLWKGFTRRSADAEAPGRLTTMMSTLEDVHGHVEDGTEVPRETLVGDLQEYSHYHTTQAVPAGQIYNLARFAV